MQYTPGCPRAPRQGRRPRLTPSLPAFRRNRPVPAQRRLRWDRESTYHDTIHQNESHRRPGLSHPGFLDAPITTNHQHMDGSTSQRKL
ncbi:unnamed protein product [Coccothraustes coccothraustes]